MWFIINKIAWIVCGGIWALLIVGFIALVIIRRIKNRNGRGD